MSTAIKTGDIFEDMESESSLEGSIEGVEGEEEATPTRSAHPIRSQRNFLGMRWSSNPGYGFKEMISDKNYNAIVTSYFVPIFLCCVGIVYGSNQLSKKYAKKIDETLASYASEMVYHDGDFEEMKLCYNDERFVLHRIDYEETIFKLCRVNKVFISPNKISVLVTHDGRTIRYLDPLVKVNDTVACMYK